MTDRDIILFFCGAYILWVVGVVIHDMYNYYIKK